jgi:hypothetical protein
MGVAPLPYVLVFSDVFENTAFPSQNSHYWSSQYQPLPFLWCLFYLAVTSLLTVKQEADVVGNRYSSLSGLKM